MPPPSCKSVNVNCSNVSLVMAMYLINTNLRVDVQIPIEDVKCMWVKARLGC